jgi:ribosomal protein S27E
VKKELNKEFDFEKIGSIVKKCPKCFSLSLEFDTKQKKLICKSCGFSQDFLK